MSVIQIRVALLCCAVAFVMGVVWIGPVMPL